MALDETNPVVQEHIPTVLGQLVQKLTSLIQSRPHDRSTRGFRILLMAVKSIIGN